MPAPPEWLAGAALDRWHWLVSQPAYASILSVVDDAALLHHCIAWQTIADKTNKGDPVLAFDLQALRSSLQILGLSPADRARIKLPEAPKQNKWDKFRDRPGSLDTVKPS